MFGPSLSTVTWMELGIGDTDRGGFSSDPGNVDGEWGCGCSDGHGREGNAGEG